MLASAPIGSRGRIRTHTPRPHLLREAVKTLATEPYSCLTIGDSVSDIDAAHAAGTPVVAYANKPGKRERFQPHAPDAIIDSMAQLVAVQAPASCKCNPPGQPRLSRQQIDQKYRPWRDLPMTDESHQGDAPDRLTQSGGSWGGFLMALTLLSLLGLILATLLSAIGGLGGTVCGSDDTRFLCTPAGEHTLALLPWGGWIAAIVVSLGAALINTKRGAPTWPALVIGGTIYALCALTECAIAFS